MRGLGRFLTLALVLALAGLIPLVLGWDTLPDPMAVHWGPDGRPDGAMSKGLIWLLPVSLVAVGLVIGLLFRVDGRPSAEGVGLLGFFGGMSIWISFTVTNSNRGASTWQEAGVFDLWQVVGAVMAGVLVGGVGLWLGKRWYPITPTLSDIEAPALDLADDERATWIGTAKVRWPFLLLAPFGVVFLFLPGWLKILAPVYLVLAYLMARVSVVVDAGGMAVRLGGVLTVKRIPLDEVASARPIDLEPTQWGGWGYRMIPGATAVVLRRGDGIEVLMKEGRRFGVTVDDAATGAALLNGLAKRHQSSI